MYFARQGLHNLSNSDSSLEALCTKSLISLCNLCVLCVSVVDFFNNSLTTEAQRTQRLHREKLHVDFSCKARSEVQSSTFRLLSESTLKREL